MRSIQAETERSWIELNIENLKHNVKILTEAMPSKCELMAVVKAEAYGHGACKISTILNKMGIKRLRLLRLRKAYNLEKMEFVGKFLFLDIPI